MALQVKSPLRYWRSVFVACVQNIISFTIRGYIFNALLNQLLKTFLE